MTLPADWTPCAVGAGMSDPLDELARAFNGYASAVSAAEGFVSGKRIYGLRQAEKRLRNALWNNRDELRRITVDAALLKDANSHYSSVQLAEIEGR